jgi:hypothetical protein
MSVASSPAPGRSGRWPSGLIGTLALLIAIESTLAHHDRSLLTASAADWRLTREAATVEAPKADLLCFGDSLVKTGVVPTVLESALGLRAFNLAVIGAPPPASFFLLRRALEAGANPRALVLDFKPSTLISEYRPFVRDYAELLDPRDALDLAREDHDPGFFGQYLVHRFIPSMRLRLDIRAAMTDQLNPPPGPVYPPWLYVLERQQEQNRGAILHPISPFRGLPDPYPDGDIPSAQTHLFYPKYWYPRLTNLNYIKKFLDLAATREIPVFLLLPPIHPGAQAKRERQGLDADYETIVKKIRTRFHNVIVLDSRHSGFGYESFSDSHHLDREGALVQSEALAVVIGKYLNGRGDPARWVAIHRDLGQPSRMALEDMGQSRETLESARVRR